MSLPGKPIEEYRNVVDSTKDVQLSGEDFDLSSLVALELALLYVLHFMNLKGEDWLKEVEAPEESNVKRHGKTPYI